MFNSPRIRLISYLLILWLFMPASAQAIDLPPEAQRDMFVISLANHLKAEEWRKAYPYFAKIEAHNRKHKLESDSSVTFYHGEVAFHIDRYIEAQKYLGKYVKIVGSTGHFYMKALELLTKIESKSQNDALAMSDMAREYRNSKVVAKDISKAISLYQESSALGNSWAAKNLGEMYKYGIDVPRDLIKAVKAYRQPFNSYKKVGSRYDYAKRACAVELGQIYYAGHKDQINKDYQVAVKFLKLGISDFWHAAANENKPINVQLISDGNVDNSPDAWILLGNIYRVGGHGIQKNYEEMKRWYTLAARYGLKDAYYFYGLMYENGLGVEADMSMAIHYYKKAAVGKYTTYYLAQLKLAEMYENGNHVTANHLEAIKWYKKIVQTKIDPRDKTSILPTISQKDIDSAKAAIKRIEDNH